MSLLNNIIFVKETFGEIINKEKAIVINAKTRAS